MIKDKNKNLGFTLIELLVVIAIIGTLSSIAVINLRGSTNKASYASALHTVSSIIPVINICLSDNKQLCPDCDSDYGDPIIIPKPEITKHICEDDTNLWPPLPENWQYDIMTVNLIPNYVEFRLHNTAFEDDAIICEFGESVGKSLCRDY